MPRRTSLLPLAAIGVLGTHELAYRAVATAHSHGHSPTYAYHQLLEDTGHGWYSAVPQIWLIASVLAVAAGWLIATGRDRSPRLWHLIAIQAIAYQTVEVSERLASGESPWPGWPLLIAGLAAQIPVAVTAWLVYDGVIVPMLRTVWRSTPELTALTLVAAQTIAAPGAQHTDTPFISGAPTRGPPAR